jgi:membrane-bound ClpP family serine protease
VQVGEIGVVVSELRPGGVCDFGPARVEARCERGTIPAGRRVEVIAVVDGRPLVRAV